MLVEVVHSIEEFIDRIDLDSDVHYEIESKIIGMGDIAYVRLTLYGIGRNPSLIKCVLVESAKWNDKEVRKFRTNNTNGKAKIWVKVIECWTEKRS